MLAILFGLAVLSAPQVDFVTVCADGGCGQYEAFPDVCRLGDGRLACVFYAGYGHVSLPNDEHPRGGAVAIVYSSDEGRSWSAPAIVQDGPNDDRDPSIVQLADGRILCNFFSLEKAPGSKPYQGMGTWLVESSDAGKTWSPARSIAPHDYCSSPIRALASGRLILGLYRETDGTATGSVIYSDDQGRTWSDVVTIPNGGQRLDAETDVIELTDGSLFAAQRAREPLQMASSLSRDQGATWSESKPLGFVGHCPYLYRATPDVILLAHRLPKTSLHWTADEGRTWSPNVLVDDVTGAYPSLVNLRDGTTLIVYYEEGAGSNLRARRLRASKSSVEFLPWGEDSPQ